MGIKKLKNFFVIILMVFNFYILNARVAEIKMKNRIFPLKITNLKFYHYKFIIPTSYLIVSLKEQRFKYMKFHINEIKKIEFKKFVGGRNFFPTYLVNIYLKNGGHYISAYNAPLKELNGYKNGKKWKLKLQLNGLYEKNIYNLKEIKFYEEN